MDIEKLCMGCMKELEQPGVCPYCGFDAGAISAEGHYLRPYTILNGKYLVGRVLGEGGFGITYIGYNLNLEMPVAIKEFYPNGFVTRESGVTSMVSAYQGADLEAVSKWKNNFIKEARTLAKCSHLSGIVGVKDFFEENGTAYIAMEYLEGMTLKSYAKSLGGRIPASSLLPSLKPVIAALGEVHKQGLIHRDISPDNIMLLPGGQMKLLDFGAARDYMDGGEKSLSVMLKPGYAPEEQYRTKGRQGPWSDIYAMAGTIYKCLTGVTPPEAMERMRADELKRPNELGAGLSPREEAALLKAMEVFAEKRYQSVEEFCRGLYAEPSVGRAAAPKPSTTGNAAFSNSVSVSTMSGAPHTAAAPAATPKETQSALQRLRQLIGQHRGIAFGAVAGLVAVWVLIFAVSGESKESLPSAADTGSSGQNMETMETEADISGVEGHAENENMLTEVSEQESTLYSDSGGNGLAENFEKEDTAIHSYELIVADVSWAEAYQDCISRGGYLAHINSYEEFVAVTDQIRSEDKKEIIFWLGAARAEDGIEYYWINANVSYNPECINSDGYEFYWLENEPSFYGSNEAGEEVPETCIDMLYRSSEDRFYWNDVPNDILNAASFYVGRIGYICEYEN